jgi:DNA-binding transcriptional ArsR family regulator
MQRPTSLAPELIRAIAHPIRLRIFGALDRRPLTVGQLAAEIGEDRRCTLRHLRQLESAGVVCRASGPDGPVFEARSSPYLSDNDYSRLPVAIRRAAVASCLAQIQATAAGALDGGGFDRDDIHVSRTSLTVDPGGWQRVADELAEALERVDAVRDGTPGTAPAEGAVTATAVIMLFESGCGDLEQAERAASFSREEALLRAWDLNEDLADLLVPDDRTDWNAIIQHADQLRVLASAALGAQGEAPAAAPAADADTARPNAGPPAVPDRDRSARTSRVGRRDPQERLAASSRR